MPLRHAHNPVLPAYSDEIAQVFHLLPFYPESAFTNPGTDCPIFDMYPSYHPLTEKAMKKPYFISPAPWPVF